MMDVCLEGENMIELYCIRIAKNMLGVDDLPEDLENELITINNLCDNIGGQLRSRQTIAVIISNFKKNYDDGK